MKKIIISGLLGILLISTFETAVADAAALDYTNYDFESMKKFAITYLDGAEYVNPADLKNDFPDCQYLNSGENTGLNQEGNRYLLRSEYFTGNNC